MDGLECSEIPFSQIDLGDRYDAEYFAKKYLHISQNLKNVHTETVGKFCDSVASAFYPAATQLYSIGDTAFVRCVDCIDFPIITAEQEDRFEKIPYEFGKANKGISFLTKGELVITKVGTPCYTSIIEDYETVALSRTVLGLSNIKGIDPYYLMVFLRCKYGFEQLYRQRELTIQYQLTLPRVKAVDIYLATPEFQEKIRYMCEQYKELRAKSTDLYSKAERVLAGELSNFDVPPYNQSASIKTFQKSFLVTGRLDAEYYQPKYEQYAKSLNTNDTVATLCKIHDETFEPAEKENYLYVELADVGKSGEIGGAETILGSELPTRARRKVKAGQIIVSSIEGSLQSCALIQPEYDGALCSTGFYVLSSDSINSETLLILFKSEPIQALMKQRCSGTILMGITKDEFLSMPLPKIADETQNQIASIVRQAFSLRKQSEQLFDYAKRAVELAIEQGEDAAMAWLKEKGGNA